MGKYKRYMCLVLVILLIFSLSACKKEVRGADSYIMKVKDSSLNVSASVNDENVFVDTTPLTELVRVSRTDMTALLFSENNFAVSAYDSGSGKIWRTLPEEYRSESTGEILLTLLIDGNEYVMSSRSDSFMNNGVSYEINENSVTVNYRFNRILEDKRVIDVTVPVEYIGEDGAVTVNVDCSKLKSKDCDKDIVVKSISLLPYFGAFSSGTKEDFLLIPDGSGAIVSCKAALEKESFTVRVYGDDLSYESTQGASAIIPAFGMKSGDSSFVAVIREGAELSRINAEKATKKEGYNRVYPEFEITPTKKNEDGSFFVSSAAFGGKISVTYRLLSKGSADYVGMASAARELLIEQEKLSSLSSADGEQYPFNLRIIGSMNTETEDGRIKKSYPCNYSQCQDILMSLKAKDVNSINLIYQGVLGDDYSASLRFGTASGLSELSEYSALSGVRIFPSADLFVSDKAGDGAGLSIDGADTKADGGYICSADSIEENSKKLLSKLIETEFDGVYISDASSVLCSDFTQGTGNARSEAARSIEKEITAASAVKKLMVEKGNLYSLKYADTVIGLPDKAFYETSKSVESVPFVQAVLHSVADYSHSPINLSEDSTDDFLRAVEYGAIPFYEWYYENNGDEENPDSRYYMNSITQAQSNYVRMRDTFSDLKTERITGHSKIKKGVYLTEYGNSTQIYVNYNEKAVTVSGVTVDAKSYIRVN